MPKASFSPNFVSHIQKLAAIAKQNGQADISSGQRKWNQPGIVMGWSGDQLDITGMNLAFDRKDLNAMHNDIISTAGQSNGGRIADSMLAKRQADYMACEERAYRLRHATSVRCSVHSAAREIAHGMDSGIYYHNILGFMQDSLSAGYNGSDTGETV